MKASRFPHSLALIFGMIVVAQLSTYWIPAGRYDLAPRNQELATPDRKIELDAGALVLPSERRMLLADGSRVELPDRATLRFGDGPEIVLEGPPTPVVSALQSAVRIADRTITIPSGATLQLPGAERVTLGREDRVGYRITAAGHLELPAGAFVTESSRSVVAGTYHGIEDADQLPWHAFLSSIPHGLEKAQDIIFFVFVVGGVIAIFRATGTIDALIGAAIRRFGDNRLLLVAGMLTLFAIGSSTVGMAEEYMPFIPVLVAMGLALKLDAIVAMGIVYIGAGVGYGCAVLNPFTVLIAKGIAYEGVESDQFAGAWFRILLMIVCIAIGVHHILRYATRISADPRRSLVADVEFGSDFEIPQDTALTSRRLLILLIGVGVIVTFVTALALGRNWFVYELGALFLGAGILAACVGRLGVNTTCQQFCSGAAEMTTTALLIGFARTIEVVLDDGQVIHTIVHGIASGLDALDVPALSANGMLLLQSVCNLLIPSGSGQAYVTMPIMARLHR